MLGRFLKQESAFLIGMVHLDTLFPARGDFSIAEVEDKAIQDALILAEAGFDGIMMENFGDIPFYPDRVPTHTITGMTRIATNIQTALKQRGGHIPRLGVNVLRNDILSALAIAGAVEADYVRVNVHSGVMVTDQGVITGKAHESCRYRDLNAPNCAIFTDIQVKHAAPLVSRPLEEEAEELWKRASSDALIVTGVGTGKATDPEQLKEIRKILPSANLVIGSGVTLDSFSHFLPHADALIVGTWLKENGQVRAKVDPERAKKFVDAVRKNL